MNALPVLPSAIGNSDYAIHKQTFHAGVSDRLTGWRLLAAWVVMLAGSWALAIGIPWAVISFVRWVIA
jgi:hypothetical protein